MTFSTGPAGANDHTFDIGFTNAPLPVLSLGNLDAYISPVNRLPMLTLQEEVSLGQRLRASGDIEAAGQLVLRDVIVRDNGANPTTK